MFEKTAEGWLSKTSLLGRHRRYFILSRNELRYYKQMSDTRPAGTIELKHYKLAEKDSNKQYPYGFRIVSQCKYHRSYIFYADDERGCQYWVDVINATLNPFIGRNHTCDQFVSPLHEEPYSVLDKWLNRLDLNDDPQTQRPPSRTATASFESSPATSPVTATNPLLSLLSPTLRASRSTESLDSLPSETALSSSAGSRAHSSMGIPPPQHSINNNNNCSTSQPSSQHQSILSPQIQQNNNHTNSNPVSFVSRSLSSIKKQHSLRHHNQSYGDKPKSPTWSFDSMTTSSTTNSNHTTIKTSTIFPHKDWESDALFDFEEESTIMVDPPSLFHAAPPPTTPLPQIPGRCLE